MYTDEQASTSSCPALDLPPEVSEPEPLLLLPSFDFFEPDFLDFDDDFPSVMKEANPAFSKLFLCTERHVANSKGVGGICRL
jgi:hypothetical protein